MTTYRFSCLQEPGVEVIGAREVPSCAQGQGSWIEQPEPFDPATLDPQSIMQAAGAGFVSLSIPLIAILAGRALLSAFKT